MPTPGRASKSPAAMVSMALVIIGVSALLTTVGIGAWTVANDSGDTPGTASLTPPPVSVTRSASHRVDVAWTVPEPGVRGFRVLRSISATGPFTQIASLGADATTFSDISAATGAADYYEVQSYNLAWTATSAVATASP